MARIRSIKPEFWTDEKTGMLSPTAKCVFLGLLNHCDDYGVIRWSPREYSARTLPYLANSLAVVREALIEELLPYGLVVLFQHQPDDDTKPDMYLWITHFERHQRVDRPGKPLIPEWKKGDTLTGFCRRTGAEFVEASLGFDEDSTNTREPSRWKGKERNGEEGRGEDPDSVVTSSLRSSVTTARTEKNGLVHRPVHKPPGNGAGNAVDDPRSALWTLAVQLLGEEARALVGKAVKTHGIEAVGRALVRTAAQNPVERKSFFLGALKEPGKSLARCSDDELMRIASEAGVATRGLSRHELVARLEEVQRGKA